MHLLFLDFGWELIRNIWLVSPTLFFKTYCKYVKITGSLSIAGLIFGVLGSLSLSLYSIFTKKVLPFVNGEIWALSYANNIYSTLLLIPMMLLNKEVSELINYTGFKDLYFWFIISVGGLCGFTIGFFTTLQIKVS